MPSKFPILPTLITSLLVSLPLPGLALPLSPGDRLRISIPADEALPTTAPDTYRFSGVYEVNLDGKIYLPLVQPISAAGLEPEQVNQQVRDALLREGMFRSDFLQVTTSVVQWAPIQVYVAGGTFLPGRILIDENSLAEVQPSQPVDRDRQQPYTVSGDYPPGRYLTAAIRSAGGLKPNADVQQVTLVRNGEERVIDLSGVFTGQQFEDIPLIAGDQVVVPELDQIQNELVRPSQVTPRAIAVFISNQTAPSGTDGQVSQFTYGSRFSQAVVAARCAGGTESTNANRRVTLVQTSRLTGETQVYDEKVEDLLRNANDATINPYLMPEDSIVCYDSEVTNVTGILDFVGNILNPFRLVRSIFFGD